MTKKRPDNKRTDKYDNTKKKLLANSNAIYTATNTKKKKKVH